MYFFVVPQSLRFVNTIVSQEMSQLGKNNLKIVCLMSSGRRYWTERQMVIKLLDLAVKSQGPFQGCGDYLSIHLVNSLSLKCAMKE